MANYVVKLKEGQLENIILSPMMKQHQSNLLERFIMLFRVHHIVQHPDHPDLRLTIKTSEKLLDVDSYVFLSRFGIQELMPVVLYNILQLHKDSHDRFLSHCGDGVQLVLDGWFGNKPIPVDLEGRFISLFDLYIHCGVKPCTEKADHRMVPIVIDCEIVRCHQFTDLKEAIGWWESKPVNTHDMVPATNSSPSIYAEYKIHKRFGIRSPMDFVYPPFIGESGDQCSICLEELPICKKVASLYCLHLFHIHCITHWFKRSRTCPVCRMLLD